MAHKNTPTAPTFEERVYAKYRHMIKAFNKGRRHSRNGFPAGHRNDARKVCVETFDISFQEVKRIIAEQDARHGITHEKNDNTVSTQSHIEYRRY
jgi:hypothetical protein